MYDDTNKVLYGEPLLKGDLDLLKIITNKRLSVFLAGHLLNTMRKSVLQTCDKPYKNFIFFRILGAHVRIF